MNRFRITHLIALLLPFLLVACGGAAPATTPADDTAAAPTAESGAEPTAVVEPTAPPATTPTGSGIPVTLWSHSAGNPNEIAVVEQMIVDRGEIQMTTLEIYNLDVRNV